MWIDALRFQKFQIPSSASKSWQKTGQNAVMTVLIAIFDRCMHFISQACLGPSITILTAAGTILKPDI
jgi:hypothetical protein